MAASSVSERGRLWAKCLRSGTLDSDQWLRYDPAAAILRLRAVPQWDGELEPEFFLDGERIEHPLEHILKAGGWAILSSIERQRMAVMNVKGQLAEYYLDKHLETLLSEGTIQHYEWRKESPDFSVMLDNRSRTVECKNVRKATGKERDPWWAELQRTRNSKGGTQTRAYTIHDFDVVAVCLFNRTGEWRYWFAASRKLGRRAEDDNLLAIRQVMPLKPDDVWREDICEAINDVECA